MKRVYIIIILIMAYSCYDGQQKNVIKDTQKSSNTYEAISLLGDTLYTTTASQELMIRYDEKKINFENDRENIDNIIWFGRFTAYIGRYNDAINIYSEAIQKFPNDARLYRHRGHRYITIREFDKAIADLTYATKLIEKTENSIEPDGMPNDRNIPVSTLHGNIYYHLGLAHYLNRDLGMALGAFKQCLETSNNPDNVVSATHWIYMINKRLGREIAAANYIKPISKDMDIIENESYLKACLFYKGEISIDDLQQENLPETGSNTALRYAVANWFYYTGFAEKAEEHYTKIVEQGDWASFGYIAAENDLAKLY